MCVFAYQTRIRKWGKCIIVIHFFPQVPDKGNEYICQKKTFLGLAIFLWLNYANDVWCKFYFLVTPKVALVSVVLWCHHCYCYDWVLAGSVCLCLASTCTRFWLFVCFSCFLNLIPHVFMHSFETLWVMDLDSGMVCDVVKGIFWLSI